MYVIQNKQVEVEERMYLIYGIYGLWDAIVGICTEYRIYFLISNMQM